MPLDQVWQRCKPGGQTHQPYFELLWRVDPQATQKLMESIWAGHILDWSLLDYNRHASVNKAARPRWDHTFVEDVEVPFPAKGGNLSFANVTPPLLRAGTELAVLAKDRDALTWTHRLLYRWEQAKDPQTGLCGGQLSYRTEDRAQAALGHVHPTINEAKMVASYHQISRDYHLPLAQMQAGETLIAAGGERADCGRDLVRWASDDLSIYALLELDRAKGDRAFVKLACCVGDNLVKTQSKSGLFPRPGRMFARTGDEAPLALLHLAAALTGKSSVLPAPILDSRLFHCEYDGPLTSDQKKRADSRTYDHLVFYGRP